MLWMVQRVLYGEVTHDENRTLPDLSVREHVVLGPLVALALIMGVASPYFTRYIQPSVDDLIATARARRQQSAPIRLVTAPAAPAVPAAAPVPARRAETAPAAAGPDADTTRPYQSPDGTPDDAPDGSRAWRPPAAADEEHDHGGEAGEAGTGEEVQP
jgi:hypothetical protein